MSKKKRGPIWTEREVKLYLTIPDELLARALNHDGWDVESCERVKMSGDKSGVKFVLKKWSWTWRRL